MEYCMICRRTFKKYLYKVFASEDGIFPFKDLLTLFGDSIVFPVNRHICVLCLTVVRIIGDFKKVLLQIAVSDTTLESEEVVAAFLGFQSLLQNVPYCVTTDDELYEHFSESVSVQNYSEISGVPDNQILNTYDNDDRSASSDDELTLITPLYSESARVTASSQPPTPNSQEIEVIMKKRKRRGSQKPFTRRKVRKSRSRVTSAMSEETFYPRSRATSRASVMSHTTIASTSRAASAPKYDDNYILINKRTREVGKLQEEDLEIITQKESLEIAYKCNVSVCCQQYESLDQLNKHLISDHEMKSEDIDVFDYNAWLNSYNDKENNKLKFPLKYEQPSLIVDSKNKYPCPINSCNKRFECLNDLSKHKITGHHLPEYYPCNECSLKFTSQKDLEYHFESCHSEINAQCMFCSQHFENIYELYVHLSRHEYFSVPCRYCDKYFLDHTSMMAHKKTHDGERDKVRIKRSDRHTIRERTDTEVHDHDVEDENVTEFCRIRTQEQAKAEEQEREREDLARILEDIEKQKNQEKTQNDNGIVDRIDNEDTNESLPEEIMTEIIADHLIDNEHVTEVIIEANIETESSNSKILGKHQNVNDEENMIEIINEENIDIIKEILNEENMEIIEEIEDGNISIAETDLVDSSEVVNLDESQTIEDGNINIVETDLVDTSEIVNLDETINETVDVENIGASKGNANIKSLKYKNQTTNEKVDILNTENTSNEIEAINIPKITNKNQTVSEKVDTLNVESIDRTNKEKIKRPKIKNRTSNKKVNNLSIENKSKIEEKKAGTTEKESFDVQTYSNKKLEESIETSKEIQKDKTKIDQIVCKIEFFNKEKVKSPKIKQTSRSNQVFNEENIEVSKEVEEGNDTNIVEEELAESVYKETVITPKIKKRSRNIQVFNEENVEAGKQVEGYNTNITEEELAESDYNETIKSPKIKKRSRKIQVFNEENVEAGKQVEGYNTNIVEEELAESDYNTIKSPKTKKRSRKTQVFNEENVEAGKQVEGYNTDIVEEELVESDYNKTINSPKIKKRSRNIQVFNEENEEAGKHVEGYNTNIVEEELVESDYNKTINSPKIKKRSRNIQVFNEENVEASKQIDNTNIVEEELTESINRETVKSPKIKTSSRSTQVLNEEVYEVSEEVAGNKTNIFEDFAESSSKMKKRSRSIFNEENIEVSKEVEANKTIYEELAESLNRETVKSSKIKNKHRITHKEVCNEEKIEENIPEKELVSNIQLIEKVKSSRVNKEVDILDDGSIEEPTKLANQNVNESPSIIESPNPSIEEIAIIEKDIEVDDEEVFEIFASHSASIAKRSKSDSELKNELFDDFMKRQAVVIIEDSSAIINSHLERSKLKHQRRISKSKRRR